MVEINMIRRGNSVELAISGRIDANSLSALEQKLLELADEFDELTLDFAKVSYISSAGLRALKKTHRAMQTKNGKFALKNVRKSVMDIFQATGFIGLLELDNG